MNDALLSLTTGLLGATVPTAFGYLFTRRQTAAVEEIRRQFAVATETDTRGREWTVRAVEELLAPLVAQFDRTALALKRWRNNDPYVEDLVVYPSHKISRDLLTQNGHLVPPELREHSAALTLHYDVWLEAHARARKQGSQERIFVGSEGFPFPQEAEQAFRLAFARLWDELYGHTTRLTDIAGAADGAPEPSGDS